MKLVRIVDRPVLEPRPHIAWEKDAVLNAAACHDGRLFHVFYRAVAHNPGDPNRSCIGHAWSSDGIHFEQADEPILWSNTCPEEARGVEDPRITFLEGQYHLLYTAYSGSHTQVARATSTDLHNWTRHGVMFGHELFGNNKNATLFPEKIDGRYALIHRPMGYRDWNDEECLDMWLSFSDDLKHWDGHRPILRCRHGEVDWEHRKIGLGGTPMKTDKGWLTVYHAVDGNSIYRLGLALLDLERPTKVIWRTDEPILQPEADWELAGDVNNVVFTCGHVLLDKTLWVYYGGADTVIGVATGDVSELGL